MKEGRAAGHRMPHEHDGGTRQDWIGHANGRDGRAAASSTGRGIEAALVLRVGGEGATELAQSRGSHESKLDREAAKVRARRIAQRWRRHAAVNVARRLALGRTLTGTGTGIGTDAGSGGSFG